MVPEHLPVLKQFMTQAFTYFLIKNGLPSTSRETFLSLQEFVSISLSLPTPEVGQVKYIQVLDEISDNKDTILHVISDIYDRYMVENGHKFVVLIADAKVYEVIKLLKFEYKPDLNWLVVFPGDWLFLKNYQLCLMKPFLEAGFENSSDESDSKSEYIETEIISDLYYKLNNLNFDTTLITARQHFMTTVQERLLGFVTVPNMTIELLRTQMDSLQLKINDLEVDNLKLRYDLGQLQEQLTVMEQDRPHLKEELAAQQDL